MKIVAAIFLALVVAATGPTTLATHSSSVGDECSNQITPTSSRACIKLDVPSQTPGAIGSKTGNHLYVLFPASGCTTPSSCYPVGQGQNLLTCSAGFCTATRLGIVYADTNGVPGLQTEPRFIGGLTREADMSVLA